MSREVPMSPFLRNIDSALKSCGENDSFLDALDGHLKLFVNFLSREGSERLTHKEVESLMMAKLFLDKIHNHVPKGSYTCKVDENSEWPVQQLPLELFVKETFNEGFRRTMFFNCLEIGDILDCTVETILPTQYHLRVIHKFKSLRILNDLNIKVGLHRTKAEMSKLSGALSICEIVRVAVSAIHKEDAGVMIEVTLNVDFPDKNDFKLGKITEKDLPSYIVNRDKVQYESYVEYLNASRGFRNHVMLQELTPRFGLRPDALYSFFPEFSCMQCSDEFTGQALLKTAKRNDYRELLNAAAQEYKKDAVGQALQLINSAIELDAKCPDAYELRGKIYAENESPKLSKKALLDFERVYAMDKSSTYMKEQLSRALFITAQHYYRMKVYQMAVKTAEEALRLNPKNSQAILLMEYLKEKHPEAYLDLDAVSLYELQAKKHMLVSELEQIGDSVVLHPRSAAAKDMNKAKTPPVKSVPERSTEGSTMHLFQATQIKTEKE